MRIALHNCEWCNAFMAHLCPYCMHFTCRDCVVYPAPETCKHERYIPPISGWEKWERIFHTMEAWSWLP
jgi:hypothetical protein